MKKKSNGSSKKDDLDIAPFTSEQMRGGVMGKYYRQAMGGRRTVTLESDVAKVFRDEVQVNEALRLVQKMREIGKVSKQRKSA